MARKKNKARPVKKQPTMNAGLLMQQMEKESQGIAQKTIQQVTTKIQQLKQQQSKLKAAWNKAQADKKRSDSLLQHARQAGNTARGKKQLANAKRLANQHAKSLAASAKQLKQITNELDNAMSALAKLNGLRKHIAQFKQMWAKQAKQLSAAKKAKTTASKKKRKVSSKKEMAKSNKDESHYSDQFESTNNNPMTKETEELMS